MVTSAGTATASERMGFITFQNHSCQGSLDRSFLETPTLVALRTTVEDIAADLDFRKAAIEATCMD